MDVWGNMDSNLLIYITCLVVASCTLDKMNKLSTFDIEEVGDLYQQLDQEQDSYEGIVILNCEDEDNDGFGKNCLKGPDCDDHNPYFGSVCPNCNQKIVEGCPCTKDSPEVSCYQGPLWTVGVGICREGKRVCVDGFYGGCNGEVLPRDEECNGKDDDCDGEIDEETTAPCGVCTEIGKCVVSGPHTSSPFYPDPQKNASSVGLNSEGGLILNNKGGGKVDEIKSHFIWIANSAENTVSRLDTDTGWEVARYEVCIDPSRTSVDNNGNVWVGCRGDGHVVKIALDEIDCKDKNGNGVIETSKDIDGDHKISLNNPQEILPMNKDECVIVKVAPYGFQSTPRGVAADKTGDVWVGFWNEMKVAKLDKDTGLVKAEIAIPANPYGLALDQTGDVWVSGRGGNLLVRINTKKQPLEFQSFAPPFPCVQLYGIAVDPNGNIWLGNSDCPYVLVFLPNSEIWKKVEIDISKGYTRGVAVSKKGIVYFAHNSFGCGGKGSSVTLVSADTFTMIDNFSLGEAPQRGPVGVALDMMGRLWTVNQCTATATCLDAETGEIIGEYPVGNGPYTYSDMTGYALKTVGMFQGYYQHILKSPFEGKTKWTALNVVAKIPEKTSLSLRFRANDKLELLEKTGFISADITFPPGTFPIDLEPFAVFGTYLEVEVNMYSSKPTVTPVVMGINALAVEL